MTRWTSTRRRVGIIVCVAMLALGLAAPATGVEARRSVCKTYDQAEFYLVTGIDSYYGGTICVR